MAHEYRWKKEFTWISFRFPICVFDNGVWDHEKKKKDYVSDFIPTACTSLQ